MLSILKHYYDEEVIRIDREVQSILIKFGGHSESPTYKRENTKLKENLERYNQQIITNKDKKFTKDQLAFQRGRAYKWHNVRRYRNYVHKTDIDLESAFSDYSSVSSAFSLQEQSNVRGTRFNHRT